MGVPYQIREASADDLFAITELERLVFTDPWHADTFADCFGPLFLVALHDGVVVGYVLAQLLDEQARILNLAVAPPLRRHGVATRLWIEIESRLRVAGIRRAILEVRESNLGARDFYVRHGFRAVGHRRRYYDHPTEDALVMRCCVDASVAVNRKGHKRVSLVDKRT